MTKTITFHSATICSKWEKLLIEAFGRPDYLAWYIGINRKNLRRIREVFKHRYLYNIPYKILLLDILTFHSYPVKYISEQKRLDLEHRIDCSKNKELEILNILKEIF